MNSTERSSLNQEVELFTTDRFAYFNQWMFDEPVLISSEEDQDVKDLQKVLYKFINKFVSDYDQWAHLMPLNKKSARVVKAFRHRPYAVGSYRVDTVFDQSGQQKIIETTCRFPLNGFFVAGVADKFSQAYQLASCDRLLTVNRYNDFLSHLNKLIGEHRKIIVLKNADTRNSSKYFIPIFQKAGFEVVALAPEEVEERNNEIGEGFVISELSIEELELLSDETLQHLANSDMINDLRTVVLIHDKRFHAVLGDENLRRATLSSHEVELLDKFYVPTFCYGDASALWKEAQSDKGSWIMKHRSLGKSKEVYAGIVSTEQEWSDLFTRPDLNDFVLQRWIEQPRVKGTVNGKEFNDFVTGTLLFFDDNYFGPGMFRTSSFPVSNKVDDRKMFGVSLK